MILSMTCSPICYMEAFISFPLNLGMRFKFILPKGLFLIVLVYFFYLNLFTFLCHNLLAILGNLLYIYFEDVYMCMGPG